MQPHIEEHDSFHKSSIVIMKSLLLATQE